MYATVHAHNLTRVLSLGLLGPRCVYGAKYEPDAASIHDGWLPLYRQPPGQREDRGAKDDSETALVELDDASLALDRSAAVVFTDGVIPVTTVTCVHFSGQGSLDEFRTTLFDNVDAGRLATRVSPELFGPGNESTDSPPSPSGTGLLSAEMIEEGDRLTGALAAVAIPITPSTAALDLAVGVLQSGARGWAIPTELVPDDAVQVRILEATQQVLSRRPLGERVGADVLEEIVGEVADDERASKQVRAVGALLTGRRAFEGFRDARHEATSALALVALAGGPGALRDWPRSETNASDRIEALALWLAGWAKGRARMPTDECPGPLDDALSDLMARRVNLTAKEPVWTTAVPAFSSSIRRDRAGWVYSVVVGGDLVDVGRRPLPDARSRLADLLASLEPSDPHHSSILRRIAPAVTTWSVRLEGTWNLSAHGGLVVAEGGTPPDVRAQLASEDLAELIAGISSDSAEEVLGSNADEEAP